ncbi:MAG: translocation/assembly module TamB domain-containing protein [Deltaproteobacteria bacterium]|nr:translocation/assembly module TamB domain-containing protein [Deltaproteobacteria bacterium]
MRRILLILFIVATVVVVAAGIYANSSAARRHVRSLILKELNETWGIPTEIESVEVRLFPLTITVYGLRISHVTEGPFLETRALTITPDLWSLARGRYRFEEVALVEPRLFLKVRDGRLVNLPRPHKAPSDGTPTPLLDAFAAVDGTIVARFENEGSPGVAAELRGVNLDVTGSRNELFEVRALVSGGRVAWGDFVRPLERFEARVSTTPAELRIRRLAVELGDDVQLKVERGTLAWGGRPEVHLAAQAALPLELLDRLPDAFGLPDLVGRARVSGQIDYGLPADAPAGDDRARWRSRLLVDIAGAYVAGRYVGDLDGIVRLGSDALEAEGLRLDAGIGRLTVDGRLDLVAAELPYRGTVRMERLEFAPLLERFGVPRSKCVQTFDGTIEVTGTSRPFFLRAEADTDVLDFGVYDTSFRFDDKLVILDFPKAHATGGIEVDSEQLTMIPSTAVIGDARHLVTGGYRFDNTWFMLDIVSEELGPGELGELLEIPIDGRGPAHTHLEGPLNDLTITAEMDLRDFRYLDKSFGNAKATLFYADEVLSFPEIHATTGDSRYSVLALAFDLSGTDPGHWTATADIRADGVHVHDVPTVLRDDPAEWAMLDGVVDAEVGLTYRSRTNAFDISFDGRARQVTYEGEPLDLVVASGRWRGGAFQIPRFRLERSGGWVEGRASYSRKGRLETEFHGEGLPLEEFAGGLFGDTDLRAKAAVNGTLEGPVEALTGRVALRLTEATLAGRSLGAVAGELFLEAGREARIEGTAEVGNLRFAARADLVGRRRVGVEAEFDGLEPLPFVDDPRLGGYGLVLSGRTAFVAELGHTVSIEGKVDLSRFELDTPQGRVSATESVWLDFDERGVDFRRGRFEAPAGSRFTLLGRAGTDRLDLDLQGTADLTTVLALLAPDLPGISGRLEVGARLTGTLEVPQLVGTVHLLDGKVAIGDPWGDVIGVTADLTLTPSLVTIDRCSGRFLDGNFRLGGGVGLERFTPVSYDLYLDFGGFATDLTETLPVTLDGTVRVAGDRSDFRPVVTGDVWVTRLAYTDPIRLGVSLSSLGRATVSAVPTFRPEDDVVRFDVRLHGEGLSIRNNLIDAAFHIDDVSQPFRLVGTNQLYGLVGAMVIDHGQMRFRRSVFDVTRGVVTFDSPWKIDPRFDVVAETEVRDWRIILTATGRRDDLRLLTTANPGLPEEDVVLLLTLGMTREEVELLGAEGAVGGALAEVFDEALGVSERVNRYVPLIDQMRLTTEYSTRTGRSEPRISIGKRLSDQVRIEASSALTDTHDFRAVFSYEVTDQLSFEGVYDNNNDQQFGNVGADVRWRIEF